MFRKVVVISFSFLTSKHCQTVREVPGGGGRGLQEAEDDDWLQGGTAQHWGPACQEVGGHHAGAEEPGLPPGRHGGPPGPVPLPGRGLHQHPHGACPGPPRCQAEWRPLIGPDLERYSSLIGRTLLFWYQDLIYTYLHLQHTSMQVKYPLPFAMFIWHNYRLMQRKHPLQASLYHKDKEKYHRVIVPWAVSVWYKRAGILNCAHLAMM